MSFRVKSVLLLAAAALFASSQTFAQDATPAAAPQAAAPAEEQRGVEEIIITSTKREANIQDVPIAVSAFSGDDLTARGVSEFEEIEEVSPSIQVNTSNGAGGNSTVRVRGVGTTGNNPGLEAAVGTFIDGVYRSRSGQAFSDLLDIERIEILRGPQGTLFGKNTSAGAIHVITKKPALSEAEGFAQAELGNYNHKRVAVSYSAPIIDDVLGFRVSGSWADRDGFVEDANSSKAWVNRDRYQLRGQLLWAPTDAFEARLIGDYGQRDESCCPAGMLIQGPTSNRFNGLGIQELATSLGLGRDVIDIPLTATPAAGTYPFLRKPKAVLGRREVGLNSEPSEKITDWGVQLDMTYDFDWAAATSITSIRKYSSNSGQDVDFTSADILSATAHDSYKTFSEELRLAGDWKGLDWLVGVYGYTEEIFYGEHLPFGSQAGLFVIRNAVPVPGFEGFLPNGAGYSEHWNQDTGGYAFFTNNTYHITDALSFTFGARYSNEKKDAVGINNNGPIASRNGVLTGAVPIGALVPVGVNEAVTGLVVPGAAPWCEELTTAGLGAFRNALRGFCDNASFKNTATEKEWTGTISLGYAVTEDINVYGTVSRGYKAGGFNLDQESVDIITAAADPDGVGPLVAGSVLAINDDSRFKPEFSLAYELGIKGTYLDGLVRVNLAGFFTQFDDFQLNAFNGLGFTIENVGKAETVGFELESTMVPTDGLVATLGITYADARYGKNNNLCFPHQYPDGANNNCSEPGHANPPLIPDTGAGASGFASGGVFQDYLADGHRLTNAPAWVGSLGLSYEHQLPQTEWVGFLGSNLRYTGRKNTGSNLHPLKMEDAHFFLNAQFGARSPDGHWEGTMWATNLTNEYENNIIFDGVTQAGTQGTFYNPPRMWGGTIKYNF